MRIKTEDEYSIVSIKSKKTGLSADEMVAMFRAIALANDYHPDNIAALMPNEHELDKIIEEAVEEREKEHAYEENWALVAIRTQCKLWKENGCKHVTKAEMLDIISTMAS